MWSNKYNRCIKCGTIKIPHQGRGLCKRCYREKRRFKRKRKFRKGKLTGKRWTKKEKEILKKHLLIEKLQKLLPGRSYAAIATKITQFKIRRNLSRAYNSNVNHDYFKKWSNNMAYILGILLTDGIIAKDRARFGIKLQKRDRPLLVKIKNELNPKAKIFELYNSFLLWISSSGLINDLAKMGITSKKSFTVKMPKVPRKYFWHFVRGIWDGDGTLGAKKMKYRNSKLSNNKAWSPQFNARLISCSKSFIYVFKEYLRKYGKLESLIDPSFVTKKLKGLDYPVYYISYSGKNALKLCKLMYKNAKIYLPRKFKVYIKAKKLYETKPRAISLWAVGLKDFLKNEGDGARLSKTIGFKNVYGWRDLKTRVSEPYQKKICSYFKVTPTSVFSKYKKVKRTPSI